MIVKERASAFYGTPILAELNRMGIGSLIICGESTSGCVRASAVDAYSAGYHVSIAEECVFDRSILSHKINLFDLHHKYADVMPLSDIVSHLEDSRFQPKPRGAATGNGISVTVFQNQLSLVAPRRNKDSRNLKIFSRGLHE